MRGKRWKMNFQGAGTSGGGDRDQQIQTSEMKKIRSIERAGYTAVLKAFRAQADFLTLDRQIVMTNLRRALNISEDEHRETLDEVNADEFIRSIMTSRANMNEASTSRVYSQPSFTNTAYQLTHHGSSESSEDELSRSINDPLIGRKLMIGKSNLNEAVTTEHDPRKGSDPPIHQPDEATVRPRQESVPKFRPEGQM